MSTIQFLAEWALRSSVLIVSGALLLRALRVRDPSLRLAAWIAMLCASLAIPALMAALPTLPLVVVGLAPVRVGPAVAVNDGRVQTARAVPHPNAGVERPGPGVSERFDSARAVSNSNIQMERRDTSGSKRFDWARAAVMIYALVALALLLRLCFGLAMSLRMLRRSGVTGQATEGIEIRESDRVTAPVTLGIVRSIIVLPGDWREWDSAKLKAVLGHERSHIRRHDPAVQLLAAIHRAVLWHTPLSWFLHRQIVRVAEEISDDAAVAITRDRTLYAEILLEFMRRGVWRASWQGVPVARYGRADKRIHRILDGTALSHGVTRWGLAAILALGLPIAYLAATAHPQSAPPTPPAQVQMAGKPSPAADATEVKRIMSLGDFHLGRGEWDDAITYYYEGLRLDPANADLRQKLDNAVKTCKKENAILHKNFRCGAAKPVVAPSPTPGLTQVPKPVPTPSPALSPEARGRIMLGDFHLSRGEYDEAIAHYQEALRLDPANTQFRQKLDEAIMACKKDNAILNEGLVCGARSPVATPPPTPGSVSAPKSVPTPSPALNPEARAPVNVEMGDFNLRRGEFDEAIADYEEVLRLNPANTQLRQKLDEAIKACKKENAILNEGHACGARSPVVTLIPLGEYSRWNQTLTKGQTVPDNSIEGGLKPMGSLTVPPSRGAPPQAFVVFMIGIDQNGNVTPGRKLSDDNDLGPQVMVAAKRWKFEPPTVNGEPVSTSIQVLVVF